jgi:hypothetical protein
MCPPAVAAAPKAPAESSYLGFLYALEEVAVYGYVTPLKLKIVVALALTDAVVRDVDIISVRLFLFCSTLPALYDSDPTQRLDVQGAALGVLQHSGQPVPQTPYTARCASERAPSTSRQPAVDVFPPTRRRGCARRGCVTGRFRLTMKRRRGCPLPFLFFLVWSVPLKTE